MDKHDKILDKEVIKLMINVLTLDEFKLLQEKDKDINSKNDERKKYSLSFDGLTIRPYVNLENLQSEFDQAVKSVKQMQESENGMSCTIDKNTAEVQLVGNRRYIIIQDF